MAVDPKKYEKIIGEYIKALETELGELEASVETITKDEPRETK